MIRGLEDFLQDARLQQEGSLSLLEDTRLGIDLSHYLRQLLSSPATKEPLAVAVGGQPHALISHIEEDLRVLEQHRIKPVFVLNGLSPAKRSRPFSYEDRRPELRKRAWEAYEAGNVALTHQHLSAGMPVHYADLYRSVLRMLRDREKDFIVAPYLATGQLVALVRHPKEYVHAMYGPTELLVYERVDQVITQVDLRRASFKYVSKHAIMRELRCNESEFLDVALLAGMEFCPTFPPLQDENVRLLPTTPGTPSLRALCQLVKQYRTGFMLCSQFAEHPGVAKNAYVDQFCHARTIITFCLVLSAESGQVVPLPVGVPDGAIADAEGRITSAQPKPLPPMLAPLPTLADVPSDLHEVYSFRLPDEVMLYLSRGLVGTSVLGSLLSGFVIEPAPLDNGEAAEYRDYLRHKLVEPPTGPRCVALALAVSGLHAFWRSRKVAAVYWFAPHTDHIIPHGAPAAQTLVARTTHWMVPAARIEEELHRQNWSRIDLPLCLGATAEPERAARTREPREANARLEKKDEILANTLWRLLELRGFLAEDHSHTAYGRALHHALGQTRVMDRLQEPLLLALELVRDGVLHGRLYSGTAHSGGPSFGTEEEHRQMLLVIRAVSLVAMVYKPAPWDAPLSRELLVFNSFVRALTRSLRSLSEMVTLAMLLRGEARRVRDDYLDISLSLPFQTDTSTGMGILAKCYLDAIYTLQGGPVRAGEEQRPDVVDAKQSIVEMLVETFENVRDVRLELTRCFRFWSALAAAIERLHEEQAVDPELAAQFRSADAWLRPMML